jgi:type IV pilus assembly protein PilB
MSDVRPTTESRPTLSTTAVAGKPPGYRPPAPGSGGAGATLLQHLLREQLLTPEQVAKATKDLAAARNVGSVPLFAIRAGVLNEVALLKSLSKAHGMPAVDLMKVEPDEKVLRTVTAEVAHKHRVMPLRREGQKLTVAITDPWNHEATDTIRFATRYEIFPVLAGEASMQAQLEKYYPPAVKASTEETVNSMLADITSEMSDVEVLDTEVEEGNASLGTDEAPVVRLINAILIEAVQRGASDIHFECFEHELRVRYRVDGALQEVMKPPIKLRASLVSRFKIMSQLNIAERRVPQDGRIKLKFGGKVIDFRVSTLPTLFGEKIVLRILDKGNLTLELEKFGIEPQAEKDLMEAVQNPYGMVLVTGPTGSGKTTTLYSCLSKINTGDTNIMTAEDPVEYNLFGINQVLVRNEIGMTFAAALKAFLRQDPNVIMVGEIRDLETGSIAIKAALTGHMVLSTLHTNSAPETITRLMDMGLEPFNVSSALNLILAQRLVRRICKSCREQYHPTDLEFSVAKVKATTTLGELRFKQPALDGAKKGAMPDALPFLDTLGPDTPVGKLPFFRGKGCDACNGTGYKGRQGLYEVMNMTPAIRKLIIQNAGAAELKDAAVDEGMLTLRMDGWLKVLRGITTLEQVVRETTA